MKKFILILVFMVISTILFSQTENKQQPDTTKYVYCQIVGIGRLMSNKVTIEIDFGQFRSIWTDLQYIII
jgi:hypothetical protein